MSYGDVPSGGRTRTGIRVYLNIYDLSPANDLLYNLGLGLHHSGVEISGVEYSFASGAGIFEQSPKQVPNAKYRETIDMGLFEGTSADVRTILNKLRSPPHSFHGDSYNLIQKNCNHFANALCWALLSKTIPGYVNRLSDLGICCSCLLPKKLLGDSPVNSLGSSTNGEAYAGGSSSSATSSTEAKSFSGYGLTLSGDTGMDGRSSLVQTARNLLHLSGNNQNPKADDLTDRREKARKAALARMQAGGEESIIPAITTSMRTQKETECKNGFKEN